MGKDFDLVALFRIDKVVHQAYVEQIPFQADAFCIQDVHLALQVISAFGYGCVFEDGLEVLAAAFCYQEGGILRFARDDRGGNDHPPDLGEYAFTGSFDDDRADACLPGGLARFSRGDLLNFKVLLFLCGSLGYVSDEPLERVELVFFEQVG